MTTRLDFRDGRYVEASDLNEQGDVIASRLDEHEALIHVGDRRGLVAHSVVAATGDGAIERTDSSVVLVAGTGALSIASSGNAHLSTGLHADGVTAHRVRLDAVVHGAPARPWTIGHYLVAEDGRTSAELRIAIPGTGGGAASDASKVRIGIAAGEKVTPLLTVSAEGTVRVEGDLVVGGGVVEGECPPDLGDPRFVRELRRRFVDRLIATGNVGGAALTIDRASASPASISVSCTVDTLPTLTTWALLARVAAPDALHCTVLASGGAHVGGTKISATSDIPIRGSGGSSCDVLVCFVGFDQAGATVAASAPKTVSRT